MLTTRWQPIVGAFSELNRLHDEMDRFFQDGNSGRRSLSPTAFPPINAWEDDAHLFVETELPGLDLEDLEILVVGNKLTIKGERRFPSMEGLKWLRQERGFGSFQRELSLPDQVDSESVSAELTGGVLTITLPKRAEEKPRRIEIRAS